MKLFFLTIFFFLFSFHTYTKDLLIKGNQKLSLSDIQQLTTVDITKKNFNSDDLDSIIKDLYSSDLIYSLTFEENVESYIVFINENRIIENIFINGNKEIKDDVIFEFINSKTNFPLSKNDILKDLNIIKTIYLSKGFVDTTVNVKYERYSDDRVNLIFSLNEGSKDKFTFINFIGNNSFSDSFLTSLIGTKSVKFFNLFTKGSNLTPELINFDINKLLNFYKDSGFFDVKIIYQINNLSFSNKSLTFIIEEGIRYKVEQINYELDDILSNNIDFIKLKSKFEKDLEKKDYDYNSELISTFLNQTKYLLDNLNLSHLNIDLDLNIIDDSVNLNFFQYFEQPIQIQSISIQGNSITKDKTLRSKILIEPGDNFSNFKIEQSKKFLSRYPYVNEVVVKESLSNNKKDLIFEINENKKTGNILFGAQADADIGLGLQFSIEDKNLFGNGNSLKSDFSINSEDLKFSINYTRFPINNPYLTDTFSIFNQENDLSSAYGYKVKKQGIGYSIGYSENDKLSFVYGVSYENLKGHTPSDTSKNYINENISTFDNIEFNFTIKYNTTNDLFYPTSGLFNVLNFTLSPDEISDSPYYKLLITNKNYFNFDKNDNYIFLSNKVGFAESLKGNLKTNYSFGLGGTNFKGFDYRGVGKSDGAYYLGGNKFFTSTFGYGTSFIFDQKDNINFRLFYTAGSIWDSDYSSDTVFDLRSSYGLSFDVITAVGPISLTYALPHIKKDTDNTRNFTFSIGNTF
ncbi:outer membrane protein assembly factor BamA [Alphaproteobacteria bacterium]|nr:outer membrane protein assembly factor BamA [Alphaproteobacteria bacterium]